MIFGFAIVRTRVFTEGPMLFSGKSYRGVDRDAWIDVFDDDYFDGHISSEMRELLTEVDKSDFTEFGVRFTPSLIAASRLLQHANRNHIGMNELIGLCLETDRVPVGFKSLGFDVMSVGEWSLVRRGPLSFPNQFSQLASAINPFGLLDSPEIAEVVIEDYVTCQKAGLVEPCQEFSEETIRVMQVCEPTIIE